MQRSFAVFADEDNDLTLDDPARPKHLPDYRLENGGCLLWSAGLDAGDDGGCRAKTGYGG